MAACIMTALASRRCRGTRLHAALGEQFVLVCNAEVTLTQGDAVSIAAKTLHPWQNPGAAPARVLLVSAHVGF